MNVVWLLKEEEEEEEAKCQRVGISLSTYSLSKRNNSNDIIK
jgi:hypothetical protein